MRLSPEIRYCLEAVYDDIAYGDEETARQLRHRLALVELWGIEGDNRVLEVGCGQGETTVALASVAGASGHILGIDKESAAYGRPVSIGEAHSYIKSSLIGDRIEFRLSVNLLDTQLNFPENAFDIAVFSHSSWYMDSPEELGHLFARVRPWSKHLGYAEWDLRLQSLNQTPHLCAALLQAHIHSVTPQDSTANIRALILPEDARQLAQRAGWTILQEKVIETSTPLGYGRSWEIQKALDMAEQWIASNDPSASEPIQTNLLVEKEFLRQISDETRNMSLSTYAFLAE